MERIRNGLRRDNKRLGASNGFPIFHLNTVVSSITATLLISEVLIYLDNFSHTGKNSCNPIESVETKKNILILPEKRGYLGKTKPLCESIISSLEGEGRGVESFRRGRFQIYAWHFVDLFLIHPLFHHRALDGTRLELSCFEQTSTSPQ